MSEQFQSVARRAQASLTVAIVLLGGGDTGVAHRILHGNQVKLGAGKYRPLRAVDTELYKKQS